MRHQGFSLLELITVLAIIAIAASIGIPSFRDIIKDNRIITASNELLVSLSLARTTAIQQKTNVRVCITSNPEAAAPVCLNSGTDWSNGWVVMADSARDGTFATKLSGTVLTNTKLQITGARAAVQFQRTGLLAGGNNGSFGICDERKSNAQKLSSMRTLIISLAGRAKVETPKNSGDLAC